MFYMITAEECPWCDKAKEFLENKGEGLRAFSIKDHPMLAKVMVVSKMKTVPQVWCEHEHIGGYEDLVKWYNDNMENE